MSPRLQALGTRGEGVGAATFRTAPRPLALALKVTRTRAVSMATQDAENSCSALQMLGYHQPRDSHVHG